MEYNFRDIEKKWQQRWIENKVYQVPNISHKPKFYVLDMFPYPSGAGLHVGHPLGYIASDIYARYKRLKGYNVLHPMGYDAFGLPAEQYAIEHGVHPAVSTEKNIATFRKQLDNIGFSFDWSREVRTSDPKYYRWTQWIFLQLFKSWYNRQSNKTEPIDGLIKIFDSEGNGAHPIPNPHFQIPGASLSSLKNQTFTAQDWKSFDEGTQQAILMEYRVAYCGYGEVNWCEALGTVLANDEVVNGVSERGGYPVEKKRLRQWYLRITEYADRLLEGLQTVDFSDAMKEMQSNWIGKSVGAEISFSILDSSNTIDVYTTRPDTIFGVDFMVLAPEHALVDNITTAEQKSAVEEYITYVKSRSERERMAEKGISGVFTGAYAVNPFNGRQIPIWISEYVLAGYGTGAIMAVPSGDERDHKFAKHFGLTITNIAGPAYTGEEAYTGKDLILHNSDFLDGMNYDGATTVVLKKLEELGRGKRKINYKIRDAAFSRQRYWGEPFPIIWKDGIAYPLDESSLPLELPHVESYKPGPEGEGPLANIKEWTLIPNPSPQAEKESLGAALVPKYSVKTPVQYELAKMMRKEYTEAEDALWQVLRGGKLGVKFRRQHPIDQYIVDFIALQQGLIVEVDGGYHNSEDQVLYDESRTQTLKDIGFKLIRFTNHEVLTDLKKVIHKIATALEAAAAPLSTRGEGQGVRETNTMPGYAGSSWYFLRYMDPGNDAAFCDKAVSTYWNQVDLYVGGTEHAVGHLLYSRMWTKALYDLGLITFDEPFKRLLNQGMIQGSSRFVYRVNIRKFGYTTFDHDFDSSKVWSKLVFISKKYFDSFQEVSTKKMIQDFILKDIENVGLDSFSLDEPSQIRIDVNMVDGVELDINALKNWREEYKEAKFILEDGKYICGTEVEKMSKSKYNTVNPDILVEKYGADTFRMYEMFLGPVEMSKPWDTKGIEGVHRFLKKLWRLFITDSGSLVVDEKANPEELKALHKTIKKIEEDTERFSFNTCISAFMVCVNELTDLKCHKREILEPLLILLTPYAPHVAEELWASLGNKTTVLDATFPKWSQSHLTECTKEYPISVNGKLRTTIVIDLAAEQPQVEEIVLQNGVVQKWLEGKAPKKIIFVKGKMINIVV